MTMKNFIKIIEKIIKFLKSLFKNKSNKTKTKSEEPVKPEVKRLVYTKRTDQ
jgi:hypothetical protein